MCQYDTVDTKMCTTSQIANAGIFTFPIDAVLFISIFTYLSYQYL